MRRLVALFFIAIVFVPTAARADVQLPGTIVRGYEPPAHRYGPGHRGIEFEQPPGSDVRAVADGVVTFAGKVANRLYVSVRTDRQTVTYSYLATVEVQRGRRIRAGDALGATYGRWHLGLKLDGEYADPMALFAGPPRIHLVP